MRARVFLALLAIALVPACDGPVGHLYERYVDDPEPSAGFTNATVTGAYFVTAFSRVLGAPQGNTPTTGTPLPDPLGFTGTGGTITFDGAGGGTVDTQVNRDGVIISNTGSVTYSVASDGSITLGAATGGVLPGGSVIVVSNMVAGGDPEVVVLIKKEGAFTNATVNGTYFVAGFSKALGAAQANTPATGTPLPDPLGFGSGGGTVTFDGLGGATFSTQMNRDGVVSPATGSPTYSVAPDGTFTFGSATGGVLGGGSVIVFGKMTLGTDPEVNVWIRKGGAFTNATVGGTYFVAGFNKRMGAAQYNTPATGTPLPDPLGFAGSGGGTVTFDGVGGGTLNAQVNQDGVVSPATGSLTYSVAPDGTFTLGSATGGVLAGGSVIVYSDMNAGTDPQIHVLIRK